MKFTLPINNFTQGEWGPRLRARSDVEQYLQACEELTNFIPQIQGGAQFRAGVRRLETPNAAQSTLDSLSITGYSTIGGTAFSYKPSGTSGCIVYFSPDIAHVFEVTSDANVVYTAVSYEDVGSIGYPVPSGSFTWGKPQLEQIGDIVFGVQSFGTTPPFVFYKNPETGTYKYMSTMLYRYITLGLSRDFWTAFPWSRPVIAGSGMTASLSAVTVGVNRTLTMSSPFFTDASTKWEGTWFRFCEGTSVEGIAVVTSVTSTTAAVVTVVQAAPFAIAYGDPAYPTSFWQVHAWNWYYGFPRALCGYQGRLLYSGARYSPAGLFGSRLGNVFDFQEIPEPNTTGAYGYANDAYLLDNSRAFLLEPSFDVGITRSMSAGKTLCMFCTKGEVVAYGSDGAIGPNNISFESSTSFGSAGVQTLRANNYVTFIERNGTRIRDLIFNFEQGEYKSSSLSHTSEHFFETSETPNGKARIGKMCLVQGESSIMYVLTEAKNLFAFTLDRDLGINAWARIAISRGSADVPESPYTNVCPVLDIVPSPDSTDLYMFLERDSGKFLCAMGEPFSFQNVFNDPGSITSKPVFLDFSSEATAAAATPTTFWNARRSGSFINRYSGKTVSVVADGNYIGEVAVASDAAGTFTIPVAASHVVIGYKYSGTIKTMPLEAGGQWGQPVGRHKRVDEATISFYNTLGCKYGRTDDDLQEIPFRLSSQPMNESPDYFTGVKHLTFPPGYERDFQVVIKQDKPYPCYVRGVTLRGKTFD